MNKTIDIIKNRCSLRKYDSKMIKDEDLDCIIASALRAPTAGNMMHYSIIVIKEEKMKERLSVTCDNQPFIKEAPVLLVFLADYQKWFDYYRINDVIGFCEKNGEVFHGPTEANLFLAIEDALLAAQNAVIAAESLGIGSCYIGDIMENYEVHKELLNLPRYAFPVALLCLGYYSENYKKTIRKRFPKEFVVFNETYQYLNDDKIKEMYADFDSRFTIDNNYGAKNYAQYHYTVKTNASFTQEMARSIKEVLKIWNGSTDF